MNGELKAAYMYKAKSKEAGRTVAIAKERAKQQVYQELNTKKGKTSYIK